MLLCHINTPVVFCEILCFSTSCHVFFFFFYIRSFFYFSHVLYAFPFVGVFLTCSPFDLSGPP